MLSTVIVDAYSSHEKNEMAAALEEICSPNDPYGWSSASVYSFWNPSNREIMYIGLAIDLPQRFRQHNGLLPAPKSGCKVEQIQKYFKTNEKLGFSIWVQSPLSQPVCRRVLEQYDIDPDLVEAETRELLDQGREEIQLFEGLLLESFRVQNGRLPKWNSIGGSIAGQRTQYKDAQMLLDYLSFFIQWPTLGKIHIERDRR